ncbi:CatB-related O-acetyltransferase [Blastopirellula marina]|uniref:Acetyltransferase n=1 Tax=Blastopirellula marina TaxID=124 RepID=A0A2S8GHU5_9BACT|nr:CatB-related O-acetyltransferase [Blastopirellula marina]PQO43900.1 hypothetical protein C5Y93_22200 [Blastopirellula marina]
MNFTIPTSDAIQALASSTARRSVFAPVFRFLYRLLNAQKRWRIGRILIAVIVRLEGGQQFSSTGRELLEKYHEIKIGNYSYGPCFSPGWFPPRVEIGNYTSIAAGVRVVNENHPLSHFSTHPQFYVFHEERPWLVIGDDVWIGFNAIILPGCHSIGTGAVIGAGAVVTKDVPPYAIVGGNPARVLRYRFSEDMAEELLASKWWQKEARPIADAMTDITAAKVET